MSSPDWKQRAANLEDQAVQQGNQLQQQSQQDAGYYRARQQQMQQQADTAYGTLAQQPGYNPAETGQINYDYTQLQTPTSDLQQQYLTPDEQSAISGNPYQAMEAYDPTSIQNIDQQNTDWQSAALNSQEGALNQNNQTTASQLNAAATNPALAESQGYVNSTNNALAGTQGGVAGSLNTTQGSVQGDLSSDLGNYLMTPQQQQDIVTEAGISAGVANSAAEDSLQRQAAAAGSSPQGVAAYRARMNQQTAANASDAMTAARIQASNAAAQREMGLAGIQTQTAEELGNENVGAQLQTGQMAQNVYNTQEQTRLGALQGQTAQEMQAATTAGQMGNQAAEYAGTSRLNAEQNMNNMNLSGEEYLQNTGENLLTQGENAASQRAQALATNRQATTQNVQNTQFNQGMQARQATSQGAQTVGNAEIAGQNTLRGYYAGQSAQAQQGQQTAQQQANQAYSNQYQAATGANNSGTGANNVNQQPGLGSQIIGGIAGAAASFLEDGDVVTQPTVANVGENGPEWIGPVGSAPSAPVGPSAPSLPKTPAAQSYLSAIGKGMASAAPKPTAAAPGGQPGQPQRTNPYAALAGGVAGAINNYRARKTDPGSVPDSLSSQPDTGLDSTLSGILDKDASAPQTPMSAPSIGSSYLDAGDENFAVGGVATRPTVANIGEQGPEAVVPVSSDQAQNQQQGTADSGTDPGNQGGGSTGTSTRPIVQNAGPTGRGTRLPARASTQPANQASPTATPDNSSQPAPPPDQTQQQGTADSGSNQNQQPATATAPATAPQTNPQRRQDQQPQPNNGGRNTFYGEGTKIQQPNYRANSTWGNQQPMGQGWGNQMQHNGYPPQGPQWGQGWNGGGQGYGQGWGGPSGGQRGGYGEQGGGGYYGRGGGYGQGGGYQGGQGYSGNPYAGPNGERINPQQPSYPTMNRGGYGYGPQSGGGYYQGGQGGYGGGGYDRGGYGGGYGGQGGYGGGGGYQGNGGYQGGGYGQSQAQPWFRSPSAQQSFAQGNQSYNPMAAGKIVTKPTRALIGENGPEAVVPLSNRPDAVVRPSLAFGQQLLKRPKFEPVPHSGARTRMGSAVPLR